MNSITQNTKISYNNLFVNRGSKSDSIEQSNFELPSDEKILQEVRDFICRPEKNIDYSSFDGCKIITMFHTDSTRDFMQELEIREKQIAMPTQEEYKKAEEFLDRQMDKLMAEVAKENYDLIPLLTKFCKMGESLTQEEENLIGERDLVAFLYTMNAYSEKDTRKGLRELLEGEYSFDYENAQTMAVNYDSVKQDKNGVVFFSCIVNRLSPTQREEIIEAIAKVRVYEEANGFQVANVFFKRNPETGEIDFSFVDTKTNIQTEPLILRYSNLVFESVLEMLEGKEKAETLSTDSIMQTLLKESKENKNNQGE